MTRMSDTERAAGRRADFHVYYRRNGKLYFDPMWAKTAVEAETSMRAMARELGWKIKVVRTVTVRPDA
jgi:hypothetical protein